MNFNINITVPINRLLLESSMPGGLGLADCLNNRPQSQVTNISQNPPSINPGSPSTDSRPASTERSSSSVYTEGNRPFDDGPNDQGDIREALDAHIAAHRITNDILHQNLIAQDDRFARILQLLENPIMQGRSVYHRDQRRYAPAHSYPRRGSDGANSDFGNFDVGGIHR